jgi:fused signal recognition particle receptor
MGFFDKLKKKVDSVVQSTTEAITSTTGVITEALGFNKLKDGLEKTRDTFVSKIKAVLGAGRKIDAQLLEELEETLILADIGIETTDTIMDAVKLRVKKEGFENGEDIYKILKEEILNILKNSASGMPDIEYRIDQDKKPYTILIVGVNGVGKTTTIGKLAHNYNKAGRKVLIGAADTFRAAANEQLEIWAERAGVDIVQQKIGADPAAVSYDTLQSAISRSLDVVLIDTAGRLHNKMHLMTELEKISRVLKKLKADAPHEVFLILDATTGQNAILQAKEFLKVSSISGIILTKLDGTAKGGVVIPIANELKIPVKYIGVGEKIDDLQVFDPEAFVEALFSNGDEEEN